MSLLDSLQSLTIYDLAQSLEPTTPTSPNHPPFRMALIWRHGDRIREDGSSGANELLSLGGHTGTHIDALCHISQGGQLYGGVDAEEASRGGIFKAYGVETIAPIVCRGVLLDIPGTFGVDILAPAQPITADDIQAACDAEHVQINKGDAVLIRTGWPVRHFRDAKAFVGWETGVPGPDESAARLLVERQIRITGADTIAYERLAPGKGTSHIPVHVILLKEAGIHIIEVMNLEVLAKERVYEFTFVVAPLKIVGATGSPVRPLALAERP